MHQNLQGCFQKIDSWEPHYNIKAPTPGAGILFFFFLTFPRQLIHRTTPSTIGFICWPSLRSKWPLRQRIRGRWFGGTGLSGKWNRVRDLNNQRGPKGCLKWWRMSTKIRELGKGEEATQHPLLLLWKDAWGPPQRKVRIFVVGFFLTPFYLLALVCLVSSIRFKCMLSCILCILCKLPWIVSEMREELNKPTNNNKNNKTQKLRDIPYLL